MNVIIAFLLLVHTPACRADTPVRTDCAVLEDLLSRTLHSLAEVPGYPSGGSVSITFGNGLVPSARTWSIVETVISARGASIAEKNAAGTDSLDLAITDSRCVLAKKGHSYLRTCSLTIHARLSDGSGNILFAREITAAANDTVPSPSLDSTNDSARFSEGSFRTVSGGGHLTAKAATFIALAGALAYFGFR
jgi:hypothetical protein